MSVGLGGVEIRELTLSDLELALAWRMEVLDTVFADDRPWDAGALRAANRDYYERHLGRDHIACLASLGGEAVGCGAICLQEEMPSPDNPSGRCAYLMNIYTRPAARGHGVAEQVVKWLIAAAQARDAEKIYLEATAMAAPLYAALGFAPMEGMMKLKEAELL